MKLSRVFLEPVQLSGQDNSMDLHVLKAGHRLCFISLCDTSRIQPPGSSSAVRSFSCCVDQLTINFKLVMQGHSIPGSTVENCPCFQDSLVSGISDLKPPLAQSAPLI